MKTKLNNKRQKLKYFNCFLKQKEIYQMMKFSQILYRQVKQSHMKQKKKLNNKYCKFNNKDSVNNLRFYKFFSKMSQNNHLHFISLCKILQKLNQFTSFLQMSTKNYLKSHLRQSHKLEIKDRMLLIHIFALNYLRLSFHLF